MWTVNVKSRGAKGDGKTDDTDAFNKALRTAQGNKLAVPAGHYLIDATKSLRPFSNTVIELDDNALLEVIPNSEKSYKLIRLRECDNVTIRGGTLKGDRNKHQGSDGEWGMGIHIGPGCKDITVDSVHSREMWGDGFYVGGQSAPKRVTIRNCVADFNRRQGLSIVSGEAIAVINNTFSNTRGTRPEDGIDIEPNKNGPGVLNVVIQGNRFTSNGQVGVEIAGKWAAVGHITISNNHFSGQRPLKIGHVPSDYEQPLLSKVLCLFGSYRLERTDCRVP